MRLICTRSASFIAAIVFLLIFFFLLSGKAGHTQKLDVPYVPTPHTVVASMLEVANVGPGDYVIDLGSGDGRIVIAAARRGAFGHGMDLDPVRVTEAEQNAEQAGVTDKVLFFEGDLFEADISRANVITMYLLQSVNMRLKPVLFEQLRPGTRIVSFTFSMGQWKADEHIRVDNRDVYYWVIPANLRGRWEWAFNGEDYVMDVQQEFQKITLELSTGNKTFQVRDAVVNGERVSFFAADPDNGNRYAFNGRVDDDSIVGTIQIRNDETRKIENWNATLTRRR